MRIVTQRPNSEWVEWVRARRPLRVRYRAIELRRWSSDVDEVVVDGGCLVLDDGERTEEHGLRALDRVLVADGAHVAPGTGLFERPDHHHVRVATHPAGEEAVVRYHGLVPGQTLLDESDFDYPYPAGRYVVIPQDGSAALPAVELVPRAEGARWEAVHITLPDGALLYAYEGAVVARGSLLAAVRNRTHNPPPKAQGDARLHELLDGRSPHPHRAILAPVSGRVTDADVPAGSLGIVHDGVTTIVKLPRRPRARIVFDGMWVNAGDPLTDGAIHHRDLAPLIGRQAFIAHLAYELDELFAHQGVDMPGPYSELVAAALLEGDRFVGLRRRRPPR